MAENGQQAPKVKKWFGNGANFQVTHYSYAVETDPFYKSHNQTEQVSAPGITDRKFTRGFLGIDNDGKVLPRSKNVGITMQGTGETTSGEHVMYAGNDSNGRAQFKYGVGGAHAKVTRPFEQIAVDPSVIPYGSKVYVEAYNKVMSADDTGSAIKGKHIDVFAGAQTYGNICRLLNGVQSSRLGLVDDNASTGGTTTSGATAAQPATEASTPAVSSSGGELKYVVKSGDTLSKIATKYNVTGGYQTLAKYNGISNPSKISVGQVIKIPGAAQAEQKSELGNASATAQATPAESNSNNNVTSMSEKGYVSGTGGDGLKVRKGGSTEYDKIGLLGEGQAVEIIGQASTGWYQIKYGSITGFVSNKYIKLGEAPKANSDADLAALGGGAVDASGVPLYKQGDSRWKSRILGKKKTIGQAGCAMTSTTMALNKISGQTFNPAQMDQYLDTHGGYSGDCIYWSVAAKYVGKSASSLGMSGNKAKIDKSLDAGRPCVISVKGTGHWVCVAGRNADGSYIINDPGKFDHPTAKWNGSAIKVNGYDVGSQLRLFS